MFPERELVNYAVKSQWNHLPSLGRPLWDLEQYRDLIPEERSRRVFEEMREMIGQPTLEVWRYLFAKFTPELPENSAALGVFYYYHREPDSTDFLQRESRVIFPLNVVLNSELLSQNWIDHQREKLAQKWDLSPISFGISGNIFASLELDSMLSFSERVGKLGEHWYSRKDSEVLLQRTGKAAFMVFADIDGETSDEQFMSVSEQLGMPFLVVDTRRGHHLLFPLLFRSFFGSALNFDPMEIEATSRMGLVLGVDFDTRYIFHSHLKREYVLRVTPGLFREETPRISAVVWDRNTIVKEPAQKST